MASQHIERRRGSGVKANVSEPSYSPAIHQVQGLTLLLFLVCISEIVRLKPEPRVMAWIETAEETLLYLSVLTLCEIRKGLAALPQGKRRSRLETWLEVELQARFSGRILSIDAAVADRLGLARCKRKA